MWMIRLFSFLFVCLLFLSLHALTRMLFYFFKWYYACGTVEEGRENLSATACLRVVGGHIKRYSLCASRSEDTLILSTLSITLTIGLPSRDLNFLMWMSSIASFLRVLVMKGY